MKKKRETRKNLEDRVRKEEAEKYSRKRKKSGNMFSWGIIGAIIGMIFVSVVYPYSNILGVIIFGGITGGMIGAYFAER